MESGSLSGPPGFGLWTAHFTPAIVGAPCVVCTRFSPEAVLAAIERYRVTVLAAVSTQFVMLLNSAAPFASVSCVPRRNSWLPEPLE